MYAVILAGGGGTRLHPLSRPERPKPFLPLLDERSLLQRTVERLAGLTDDITVVTDRRYERLVREQVPDVRRSSSSRSGRNTAAAIALADAGHRAPRRRGHGRPAGRPDGRATTASSGASCGPPPSSLATGRVRDRGPARDARHPGRPAGDRIRLPHPGPRPRRRRRRPARLSAAPLRGEAEAGPGRGARPSRRASPGTPGSSCGGAGRSAPRSTRYTGLLQSLGPMAGTPASLERAYEAIQRPVSIDYAVMEGAAQSGQVVMALDGRRLVRSRLLVGAARRRSARAGPGASSRPARRSRSSTTTSSSGGSAAGWASSRRPSAVG